MESLAGIVAILTVVFGVLVKIVGIPDQIRRIWRRKSTEGISLLDQIIGFIAYILWTLHGILRHDPVLVIGQFLGVVTTGVILYQFVIYRKK